MQPVTGELDLPPGFDSVRLREAGDAFDHACAIAGERGAGTFVWVSRYDLVEFAVVLEPEEPLAQARRGFFAGMTALADSLALHCPPERDVSFVWPDAVLFDRALIGGGRLAAPAGCGEEETPDWLVFSAMLRLADLSYLEPGDMPGTTTLTSEGFEIVSAEAIMASFTRHLMSAFDLWQDKGFRAVGEQYLERLPKKLAAERRLIDSNGDLLVTLPAAARPERRNLRGGLEACQWYDRTTRYPKTQFHVQGETA